MPRVLRFEVLRVDLPFRRAFRHAAAVRNSSESIFVKCVTDTGEVGFGECLPRTYVTGESRDQVFELLKISVLPPMIGLKFDTMKDVWEFLETCDGKAPSAWVTPGLPQSAAWCAVDLALLDAFGRAFLKPVRLDEKKIKPDGLRFSGVVSADSRWKLWVSLIKLKLYGFEQIKLKAGRTDVCRCVRLARTIMGKNCALRVDANMAWNLYEALENIRALEGVGIRCLEQPLDADDLEGLATLVRETQTGIIADESFSDRASLERLLDRQACTGVNVRISKCGGLVAAARRCKEALDAGLTVQIGCQVGESSLLSAAQLILIAGVRQATFIEGCYGRHLLQSDPVHPCLQIGYGGRPPRLPDGPGLAVDVDEVELNRWVSRRALIGKPEAMEWKGISNVTHSQINILSDRADDGQRI